MEAFGQRRDLDSRLTRPDPLPARRRGAVLRFCRLDAGGEGLATTAIPLPHAGAHLEDLAVCAGDDHHHSLKNRVQTPSMSSLTTTAGWGKR